jgi:hypothetical protein
MMTDRATAGCTHGSVLACHVARHAAYCRTFQTSFGIDGTRGEKHRGRGDECDESLFHETGSFVVGAQSFMPALTYKGQAAYLSIRFRFLMDEVGSA